MSEYKVEVITTPISYSHFYTEYIRKNKPCILSTEFTESWPCRTDWVTNDEPNLNYFRANFGDLTAPVVNCDKRVYTCHEKCEMIIKDYCDYWSKRNNKLLYLKDWHLQMSVSERPFYEVPKYFQSDWLNEYWDNVRESDDYRFVYIGVKDSWTPFHADVFRSFSWSANICGLKKWLLYPPGCEEKLKDKLGNLPFDVTSYSDGDMHEISSRACEPIVIFQKAGEIIFVPSDWYHQVYNMEDTISINHNWVNACSILSMFQHLCNELDNVKREIEDCRQMDGFHSQCQLILKASAGMDFKEFYEMIVYLMETRLKFIQQINNDDNSLLSDDLLTLLSSFYISSLPGKHKLMEDIDICKEKEYVSFDLSQLRIVLEELICHEDFVLTNSIKMIQQGKDLIRQVSIIPAAI